MNETTVLEVFSDYIWPWCYFITGRIERLKRNYHVDIRWIAFPLHPEIPEDGLDIEKLLAGRHVDIDRMLAHFKEAARKEGLPMVTRKQTYNSRLAQELGKWAEAQGKGNQFHNAVFRSYFVDGKNIGNISELVSVAESVGLSIKEAQKVLETGAFKEAVDLDWSLSRTADITAVPTFIMNRQILVGAQPYEALEGLMEVNNVRKCSWNFLICVVF